MYRSLCEKTHQELLAGRCPWCGMQVFEHPAQVAELDDLAERCRRIRDVLSRYQAYLRENDQELTRQMALVASLALNMDGFTAEQLWTVFQEQRDNLLQLQPQVEQQAQEYSALLHCFSVSRPTLCRTLTQLTDAGLLRLAEEFGEPAYYWLID